MSGAVLEMEHLVKNYGALRPLRIRDLRVDRREKVALVGLDAAAAEVLVNLVTGAALPDEGRVRVFGLETSTITDGDEWLRSLDRFGILSDRAVLLEDLTVTQNLAMTLTLAIDPVPADVRGRISSLAAEIGLAPGLLDRKVATLTPAEKLRVRLGRAVALGPELLLMEHPTATLARTDVHAFAATLERLAAARALTMVAATADAAFASAMTSHVLKLQPATGELVAEAGGWDRVKRFLRG